MYMFSGWQNGSDISVHETSFMLTARLTRFGISLKANNTLIFASSRDTVHTEKFTACCKANLAKRAAGSRLLPETIATIELTWASRMTPTSGYKYHCSHNIRSRLNAANHHDRGRTRVSVMCRYNRRNAGAGIIVDSYHRQSH